ncbi:MAG: hypothetical protein PVS3B3_30150 [Ktedonobacteraceae bacterium]
MSNQANEQPREEQRKRSFNPNEHVMQLRSKDGAKDYLPVQWRLVWFREQCPQGTIDTDEREIDLDREVEEEVFVWNNEKRRSEKVVKQAKGYARFKAIVTDGKGGRATGTKSENAASFPDYIEKAETGAIGRALAALGFGTQFAPELSEAHRIVDSPVDRTSNGYESNGSNGNPSPTPMRPTAISNNTSNNGSSSTPIPSTTVETPADATMTVTEQQISSIRKLSEYLGKAEPESLASMSNLEAKKVIQQLTAEYRQSKKAS